jgi:hypothetical protein
MYSSVMSLSSGCSSNRSRWSLLGNSAVLGCVVLQRLIAPSPAQSSREFLKTSPLSDVEPGWWIGRLVRRWIDIQYLTSVCTVCVSVSTTLRTCRYAQ